MVNIFKDKKFLRECAIILVVGFIVNFLCFVFGTIYSKAATPTPFPYYCFNDTYNTAVYPYIDGIVDSVKDKWYADGDDPFVIVMGEVFWNDDSPDPYWCMEGYVFWEVDFHDVLGESYASRPYEFHSGSSGNAHRFDIWLDTYRIYSYDNRLSGDFYMLGNQTIHQTDIGTYTYSYPIYVSQPIETRVGATDFTVIANNEVSDPNGDLIVSISQLPGIDNILNGITNSYNSTSLQTFPSYDGSLSIGENIENYMNWLGNSLTNGINNLGNSISGYFNNLTNSLQSWLNSINNNIYNGFKNFTDNLSSFFKPFLDNFKDSLAKLVEKLDYITQEFDSQSVFAALEDTDFKQDFNSLGSFHDELEDLLDISEPSEFSLVLHLGQINDNFISLAGDQEIDISFLHNSTIFRTFAWCIVVSGLAFIVASGIPSMLRGDKGD